MISYGAICDKLQILDFNGGLLYAYDNLPRGDFELLLICLWVVWYLWNKMVLGEMASWKFEFCLGREFPGGVSSS